MSPRASAAGRALRVGVLLRDNLVEERVFTTSAPITIGQSLRCTLSLPVEALPGEHVLFARDEGRFLLRVTRSMAGRLGATSVRTLDAIRAELAPRDHVWTVPLERGARGKLTIGEATILFQEVAVPASAPRPQLPAAVRGSLADRVDPRLAVIIGASLVAHLGFAVWAWTEDRVLPSTPSSSIARAYLQDTYEVSLPEPAPVLPTLPTDPSTTQPGLAAPMAPARQPFAGPRRPVAHQLPDAAQLREDALRMADLLVNPNATPTGSHGDMSRKTPGADLQKQLDAARDKQVTIGNPSRGRAEARPRIGTVGGPVIDSPDQIVRLPDRAPEDLPRVNLKPVKHEPGTTLTVDLVLSRISNLYMTGLQRCYAKGLAADASLAGKVTVAFTVDETGKVDGAASGLTEGVNACIESQMTGWRFPIPKHPKTLEPTPASFTVSLALAR